MLGTFDTLYAKSKAGEIFSDIMPLVLKRENILLAYRNIKSNTGSRTAGTDGLTIANLERKTADEIVNNVRHFVCGTEHGYRPKPVRRKDIPKPYNPTQTRPLGIPCIWDRLIQQCIKQIMEPICEAKFSDASYGFRPNRSAENAIAAVERHMQLAKLHYVIEFDIKGFFDNVDHSKLIRQIWALGIHDRHLIYIIRKILTAPIHLENGTTVIPTKGTPQGGIISPLLANIVLNELDHWVESQWTNNPVILSYKAYTLKSGSVTRGNGIKMARQTTALKEMYIVRYADDFRILCRKKSDAEKTKIAVTQWLKERLRLDVSSEKTRIVNVSRKYSEFLGFKIKVVPKRGKQVIRSHVADKNLAHKRMKLTEQVKRIQSPRKSHGELKEIQIYNSMVLGMHNYYRIATHVSEDFNAINRSVMIMLNNRMQRQKESRLTKTGRELTKVEKSLFGDSGCLRYIAGTNEPIYPIGYVQHKVPFGKKAGICCYTSDGRQEIHDSLRINTSLLHQLMKQPLRGRSVEYFDNRISKFSAQWGMCAVTGKAFEHASEIHCHHIIPQKNGGTDKYENLLLVMENVHRLIHAKKQHTINHYLEILSLDEKQLERLNELRQKANIPVIGKG